MYQPGDERKDETTEKTEEHGGFVEGAKKLGETIMEKSHDMVEKTKEFFGVEKEPETLPGKMKQKADEVQDWANEKRDDIKDWGERKKEEAREYKDKVNEEIKD